MTEGVAVLPFGAIEPVFGLTRSERTGKISVSFALRRADFSPRCDPRLAA